jgi:hypothetical protein
MNTLRAKILIAITDDGAWHAEGGDGIKPKQLIESVNEMLHAQNWTPPIEFYWIEVDVPVPPPMKPRHLSPLQIAKGPSRHKRRPR